MKLHKFTWNYIQITKKIINSRSSKSKSHSRSPLALWQISTLVVTVHSPLSTVQSSGNFNIFAELCIRVSPSTMNDKCTHSVKLWTADKSKHHSLNCVIAITHISIAHIESSYEWYQSSLNKSCEWVSEWQGKAMIGPGLQHWYCIKSAQLISQHSRLLLIFSFKGKRQKCSLNI